MASIEKTDQIDVGYVARLARLDLSEEDAGRFQAQLERVLGYIQQLKEVEVEGVEPTAHTASIQNVIRADDVGPCLNHDDVMANAPRQNKGQFSVPKIIE